MVIHMKSRQGNHRGSDLDLQPSASKVGSEREGRGDTFPHTHKTKEEEHLFFFLVSSPKHMIFNERDWMDKEKNQFSSILTQNMYGKRLRNGRTFSHSMFISLGSMNLDMLV